MKKLAIFLVLIMALAIFAGCQSKPPAEPTAAETEVSEGKPVPAEPPASAESSEKLQTKDSFKLLFVIKTEKGEIKGELYPNVAPNTVLNFVTLARKGFYNGLNFHRVVPGFVIQGGCPEGTGVGGPGYCIPAEFSDSPHKLGALAMARAYDPDSAGSQFYIVLNEESCKQLDRNYTVFGQVTEGMPVVLSIEKDDKIDKVEIVGDLPAELKGKEVKKSDFQKN
jgi:peptidyl-prolyl cis-trans isomerase B (cyclophilin B)